MKLLRAVRRFLNHNKRRLLQATAAVVALSALLWLAAWLAQRSLSSPRHKRAVQAWLDTTLNADVSFHDSMVLRLNLLRPSRLVLRNLEVEHPNPVFSSQFLTAGSAGVWVPPWAATHLWPGKARFRVEDLAVNIEQNDEGEWSLAGFMNPIAKSDVCFPYPMPSISGWTAQLPNTTVTLARRGARLALQFDGEAMGSIENSIAACTAQSAEFAYTPPGAETPLTGRLSHVVCEARLQPGAQPEPVAGRCYMDATDLPVRMLAFFLPGIPLAGAPGVFNGRIELAQAPDTDGVLRAEGELSDMNLAAFGLPRQVPLSLSWPLRPQGQNNRAEIRIGPPGFGGFNISAELDPAGRVKDLVLRSSVMMLDEMRGMLSVHASWPAWILRQAPSLQWQADSWQGFGWAGTDIRLALSRSGDAFTLTGDAELMNGRMRLALVPDNDAVPITISIEGMDAAQLLSRLQQQLPEPLRVSIIADSANLTWRGMRTGPADIGMWDCAIVFSRPVLDLEKCGAWWALYKNIPDAVINALPDWGGGTPHALQELVRRKASALDQFSLILERDTGDTLCEFRAHGAQTGQIFGSIGHFSGEQTEGELYLAGQSELVDAAYAANPRLGSLLDLMAKESLGLHVTFSIDPDGRPEFRYPFLDDALRLSRELEAEDSSPAEAAQ